MGPSGNVGKNHHRWRVRPLTPLIEGPDPEAGGEGSEKESSWDVIRSWFRSRSLPGGRHAVYFHDKSTDLKLMLGVLGCPLAPVSLPGEAPVQCLSVKDVPIETSSAHYIIQQYLAATGFLKLRKNVKNVYTTGTMRMACYGAETIASGRLGSTSRGGGESGCFLLWRMSPGMWSMELAIAGCKIVAGSNGKIVWRHIPWLGIHAAKGPLRPLRRTIQGLDPEITGSLFSKAQCLGEKRIGDDDCFVLKVSADRANIAERSEGPAEVIRHVLFGYFSQRSGLLVYLEDSHLTRVQAHATDTVYWETTITSTVEDYEEVDGLLVAHRGRSVATVLRFGEASDRNSMTRMEEEWRIDDVVFDVPGLSMDYFIPPAEILNTANRF